MSATSLEALFLDIEGQPVSATAPGTLERRIPSQEGRDLFVGVSKPSNLRSFRARFPAECLPSNLRLPSFRGFEVNVEGSDEEGLRYATIRLRLTSRAYNDVFTSLAEDITGCLVEIRDGYRAVAAFAERLAKWQRLLELHGSEGLSPEEQRGLYGELIFLRDCLLTRRPAAWAVRSWTGPSQAAKDFEFGGTAVEVKTTIAKQPQMLRVASERQLDDTGLARLYVYHLSLEPIRDLDQSLPALVDELRRLIGVEAAGSNLLEDKLMEAGYFDVHAPRYSGMGYAERGRSIFRVQPGFPRIVENELRPGVGDVRYAIDVAVCQPYSVTKEELDSIVTGCGEVDR
ncbi:MAG: PD-(D/E)XK motif protein [Armatimonadetes bacterium]|nr:PD-(D/E)XK motif protein [Armatimonadota bacterium]